MRAWVSKESKDKSGKRKYTKLMPGVKGTKADDKFIVFWTDPERRLKQERIKITGKPGKNLADARAKQLESQMTLGTYQGKDESAWADMRASFEKTWVSEKASGTRVQYRDTLDLFEKICAPKLVRSITMSTIDKFRHGLRERRGKKEGSTISPATVNKHLRHLRTALNWSHKRGFLPKKLDISMMREPEKEVVYMLPEHFDAIYAACEEAEHPIDRHYSPCDWWRALLVLAYMTGMRKDEMLTLPWSDCHLDDGYLIARHHVTKATRDDRIPLHPVVVDHLRKLTDYGREVFDWPFTGRTLDRMFHRIQRAAGIDLECHEDHEHTPACAAYGLHQMKKACGTMNAGRLSRAGLASFMRHKHQSTTDKYYINAERLAAEQTDALFVPESLR